MNKNIKKIIRFCLYSIIALSINIAECCQKNNFDLILNKPQEESSLPKNIEMNALFSYLNSPIINPQLNQQIINASPEKENFNIQSAISAFTEVKKRKPDGDETLANKIQKTEPTEISGLLNEVGYIELYFSSIDTIEKYEKKSLELSEGKQTFVAVTCDKCHLKIYGLFSIMYSNMLSHTTTQHFDEWYTKLNENDNSDTDKIDETTKHTELYFSSIDTIEKYNAEARKLPKRKQTFVIIKCNQCSVERTGLLLTARSNMKIHIKQKHVMKKMDSGKHKSFQN